MLKEHKTISVLFIYHVEQEYKQLNFAYYALSRPILSRQTLIKKVYYSVDYCHINYHVIIWGRAVDVNRVFVGQKRIVRL